MHLNMMHKPTTSLNANVNAHLLTGFRVIQILKHVYRKESKSSCKVCYIYFAKQYDDGAAKIVEPLTFLGIARNLPTNYIKFKSNVRKSMECN